ncbi:hypothetical protein PS691_04472 [Pseudomonas fluorescens]|uniref:Uncharacterized protein n=1 Tax=Pseudomonas fluorescens TaxID=294 RepID=A0A5E7EET5_PSEFL|nr:hypothetical protein PS691_04472 [Pseudomonas fluorescens]
MPTCARQGAGCRQWLFPWQIPQRSLAQVGAQPEGTGPTWRRAALLGAYLEQPNHVDPALPCAKWAAVAAVTKRQQTLMPLMHAQVQIVDHSCPIGIFAQLFFQKGRLLG